MCELLRTRGSSVKHIDLLQFSGVTAIPILKEAARSCSQAEIRLLLIDREYAEKFDEPGFHATRISHTVGELKVLCESDSDLNYSVWSYKTEPGIAGVIVDDWLVSVGWYHVFPKQDSPTGISIRGHREPAFIAIDHAAEPLLRMVQEQFAALLVGSDHEPLFKSSQHSVSQPGITAQR